MHKAVQQAITGGAKGLSVKVKTKVKVKPTSSPSGGRSLRGGKR